MQRADVSAGVTQRQQQQMRPRRVTWRAAAASAAAAVAVVVGHRVGRRGTAAYNWLQAVRLERPSRGQATARPRAAAVGRCAATHARARHIRVATQNGHAW